MSIDPAALPTAPDRPTLAELEPLARAALVLYGIVDAELECLRYYHNASYRVTTASARFILRVANSHHGAARLRAEMQWLSTLHADAQLLVPRPVAAPDGRLVVPAAVPSVTGSRWCTLVHWLEGAQLDEDQMPAADFGAMGAAVGHLHRGSIAHAHAYAYADADADADADAVRPDWGEPHCLAPDVARMHERIDTYVQRHFPSSSLRRYRLYVQQVRTLMRKLRADPQSHGPIHADLHPGNCLFRRDGVAIFDFEDTGPGYFLYDVATALYGSITRPDYDELKNAFATGYASARPLPADFERQVHLFQVLRTIFLAQLVLDQAEPDGNPWWEGFVAGKLMRLLEG